MSRHKRERSADEKPRNHSRLFHALANDHRRAVVRSLDETHTPIPRDALTTYVAKELFPERERTDFIEFRDRTLVQLHHVHLPMLAKADIIESGSNGIMLGPAFTAALTLLEDMA